MHSTDASLEPVYDTILSHQRVNSIAIGRTAVAESRERIFLAALCNHLQLVADQHSIDAMKHAINNYIIDQVDDWMKEKDPVMIEDILDGNFKQLCEAQAFLRNREGTPQIHWKQVLENHVKLVATYSHILTITLPTF